MLPSTSSEKKFYLKSNKMVNTTLANSLLRRLSHCSCYLFVHPYRLHFLSYALPMTATLGDTFSGGVVDGAHRGDPPFVYGLVAQFHLPVSGSHHFAHSVVISLVVNVSV